MLVISLYGPLGVAAGALVRSQIPAVVGALVYLLVAEHLLVAVLPTVGRWTSMTRQVPRTGRGEGDPSAGLRTCDGPFG